MQHDVLIAIIAGTFATGGIIVGAALTQLNSYFDHRRKRESERLTAQERERAIFHGAYALCNFIAGKLNEWDESRNLYSLARLSMTGPYLEKLIDRSPLESEQLMVSLFDLGLRLEALLYTAGFAAGSAEAPESADLADVETAVEELAGAVEIVQILLTGELPLMDDDELAKIPGFSEAIAQGATKE